MLHHVFQIPMMHLFKRLLPPLRSIRPTLQMVLLMTVAGGTPAQPDDEFAEFESFDDVPLEEPISYPAWFKLSFLDLPEDLEEAVSGGKRGLMVYLGQKYCPYCRKLLYGNFGKLDILAYTQKHFDAIGIDIHGQRSVTGLDGKDWEESRFAVEQDINFTPTLIFYDKNKREALRLSGYYPPYKFRAALEYVADEHYLTEDFRTYLARADSALVFEAGEMNPAPFFSPPPYALDRSRWPSQRPLVVFFEQGDCHACDVLHTGPLQQGDIKQRLQQLEAAQLGIWSDTPVITPAGARTTARQWADSLGLFYTPTLIFFDERGKEILRLDSVVQFYRLRNVLDYVLSRAYRRYPTFQQWRSATHR